MSDKPQYKAYEGDLDPVLPGGDYIAVERLGRDVTPNVSLVKIYNTLCEAAQRISVLPASRQPLMTMDLMKSCVSSLNQCFAEIKDHVSAHTHRMFSNTYGQSAHWAFSNVPIRWTGENTDALRMVFDFISAAHQTVFINANNLPQKMAEVHASIVLRPIFDLKARLMQEWFGIEVKGHVSVDELNAMFRNSDIAPPVRRSITDEYDRGADHEAEDAAAMGHETELVPDEAAMAAATTGVEVFTWVPTDADWAKFGERLQRLAADGPTQIPIQPAPFSTTVVGQTPVATPSAGSGAGSAGMPGGLQAPPAS